VGKALGIFRREIDLTMGQIGVASLDKLGRDFLLWKREPGANRLP
jgi:hypothetical protein